MLKKGTYLPLQIHPPVGSSVPHSDDTFVSVHGTVSANCDDNDCISQQ